MIKLKWFILVVLTTFYFNCNNENSESYIKIKRSSDRQIQPQKTKLKISDISFALIKEIKISSKILIGDISTLDNFNSQRLLITDRIGKKVFLVDDKGNLIKELDPEVCHPGFHWNPLYSFFNKNGAIYVINSNPWGFRFDKNGGCLGPMDLEFLATYSIDFKTDGTIIGYYAMGDGLYLKAMTPKGKEITRFGEFPSQFRNLIYRFEYGGIVIDRNDNIYQVNLNSTKITEYNKNYKKINEFEYVPSDFHKVTEDISNNPQKVFSEIPQKTKGKSFSISIHLVSKNIIAVQYVPKTFENKYGIMFYYTNGEKVIEKKIAFNKIILDSNENGYLYTAKQPEANKSGNLPNPVIQIYKIIYN